MPTGTTLGGREEDQGRVLLFGDPVVQVELRKFFEHRRMIGRKAGHREDPRPPGCESAGARSHPAASLPGATAAGAVRRDGVITPG